MTDTRLTSTTTVQDSDDLLQVMRNSTPARLFQGRSGFSFSTATQLELRSDHAFARDAVEAVLKLNKDLPAQLVSRHALFEVTTQAQTRGEYLRRPDLGRLFSQETCHQIRQICPANSTVQVVIGDGLSVAAVRTQVPQLLPGLMTMGASAGWTMGRPFVIHNCRVGIMNQIGDILNPQVVVLLIGERPGLATSESLSAYLAFRPQPGDTDAKRNLISNIHARGVTIPEAVTRLQALIQTMLNRKISGCDLKEELPTPAAPKVLPAS